VSSVSNGLYFLTLPLVSVMRVIYRKICHARYLSENMSCALSIHQKECQKSLGCALSIEKYGHRSFQNIQILCSKYAVTIFPQQCTIVLMFPKYVTH